MKIKDLIIKFYHQREIKGYDKGHPVYKQGGKTICTIEAPDKTVQGISECASDDIFCKDTGRKIALKRAIKEADLSKEDRVLIWERYRTSTKEPKW